MLEYMVKPIKCVRSFEERMRASQFRFSLSKQCIDYACLVVNAVDAKSLVNIQDSHLNASSSNAFRHLFNSYSGYSLNKHVQDSIEVTLLYYRQANPSRSSARRDSLVQTSCPTMAGGLGMWGQGLV